MRLLLATALAVATAAPLAALEGAPPLRLALAAVQEGLQVRQVPALRPSVMAARDVLTLGDLISALPAEVAAEPVFRAPALGETGTIQVPRIVEAARLRGIEGIREGGHAQVVVTRAARRIGLAEIEQAVRRGIESRYGIDGRHLSLVFDGAAPSLLAEPDLGAPLAVQELSYDSRTRRLTATLTIPGSGALGLKPARISGQLLETYEAVVPKRQINRGEVITAADIAIERRAGDAAPADLATETAAVVGKAARRQLSPGQPLRASDLQRQEVIARNELVTVVFEAPGLVLTMRGRAQEGAAIGDVVSVQNQQSKKILQGTVVGPGQVRVSGTTAGRIALR